MAGIVPIVIIVSLAVTGLSLFAILVFGIRNLTYGKADMLTLGLIAVPIVLLAVARMSVDSWADAAIWTVLIMLVLTSLSLLTSSLRGLIGL